MMIYLKKYPKHQQKGKKERVERNKTKKKRENQNQGKPNKKKSKTTRANQTNLHKKIVLIEGDRVVGC
jgi:hypothetical protein